MINKSLTFLPAILLLATLVSACSCIYLPDTQAKLDNAEIVFSGTVTGIQTLESYPAQQIITFQVEQYWKTPENFGRAKTLTMKVTEDDGANCGYTFQERSYLVYGYLNEDSSVGTSSCSGTLFLEDAQNDLDQLSQASTPEVTEQTTAWQRFKQWIYNLFH